MFNSIPSPGGTGGPAVDETARAAAAAAQAAADGNAEAIAKRDSRIRIFNMVTHNLGTTALKEMFYAAMLADATGLFEDIDPMVDDISRITIPTGVTRVAVTLGTKHSGSTAGTRAQYARLYDSTGALKRDRVADAASPSVTGTCTLFHRDIVNVAEGDYLVPWVQHSASGGSLVTNNATTAPSNNYILVEVLA